MKPVPKPTAAVVESTTGTPIVDLMAVSEVEWPPVTSDESEALLCEVVELEEEPARRAPQVGRTLARSVRVTVGLFLVYLLTFHTPVVRGSSMQPGLQDGDRILVEPWSELVGYNRGDIVVMRYPLDTRVDYVKRIIGLPGDRIVLGDGRLWVNGVLLTEPYVESVDRAAFVATTVRPRHFFVLGDNRPRSSDSREFGQVKADLVRGRVGLRMWPLSRLGLLD